MFFLIDRQTIGSPQRTLSFKLSSLNARKIEKSTLVWRKLERRRKCQEKSFKIFPGTLPYWFEINAESNTNKSIFSFFKCIEFCQPKWGGGHLNAALPAAPNNHSRYFHRANRWLTNIPMLNAKPHFLPMFIHAFWHDNNCFDVVAHTTAFSVHIQHSHCTVACRSFIWIYSAPHRTACEPTAPINSKLYTDITQFSSSQCSARAYIDSVLSIAIESV